MSGERLVRPSHFSSRHDRKIQNTVIFFQLRLGFYKKILLILTRVEYNLDVLPTFGVCTCCMIDPDQHQRRIQAKDGPLDTGELHTALLLQQRGLPTTSAPRLGMCWCIDLLATILLAAKLPHEPSITLQPSAGLRQGEVCICARRSSDMRVT